MDDTAATTPSPSAAATTAAGYDAARDKQTNTDVAAAVAANSASSSSVILLIKSSNQQYDDMNIESDLCWTVQRLKKQLSLVYPGKPEINDQKLIYSGKLLDDAQKLSEVIRSYKDVYQQHHIFHLVCVNKNMLKTPHKTTAPPKNVTSPPRQETNTNDNELRQRHGAAAAAAAAAAGVAGAQLPNQQQQQVPMSLQTDNWLNFQQRVALLNQMAAAQAAASSTLTSVSTSASGAQMAFQQQQAMIYQAWLQQWYTAYMQHMMQRTENENSPPMLHPLLQGLPVMPNNYSVPLVAPQPVPAAGAAGAGAAQPNGAAVAQQPAGRQVDGPNFPNIQEEPEIRDWLDSFFSFTRLALFITVLYFNSSPLRCLLVVLIAGVIYLYHIGVLRLRRERNNNNINRNNNAGIDGAAFAAVQQIQRMMDIVEEHDNNPQAAADPAPVVAAEPAPVVAAQDAPANDAAQAGAPPAAPAAVPPSAGADPANEAAATAEAAAVAVEPANANNSVISIVRTFVITFFTSMLPETPPL